ncbi:hypothetical protein HYR99_06940 [Candidatus Poribacteria bacterium]|nr:hypothetical protein [Candidatus Poribacteria bacterium]
MSDEPIIRKPAIIQEEIDDLRRYLNGIPEQLRTSGAFNSYEQRMVDLNRELVASRNQKLNGERRAKSIDDYTDEELGRMMLEASRAKVFADKEIVGNFEAFCTFLDAVGLGFIANAIKLGAWARERIKNIWRSIFGSELSKKVETSPPEVSSGLYLLVSALTGFLIIRMLTAQETVIALATIVFAVFGMWLLAILSRLRIIVRSLKHHRHPGTEEILHGGVINAKW